MTRSALIVPIVLPAELGAGRLEDDPMAQRGVPAHVTILFPFIPAVTLGPSVVLELHDLAGSTEAFVARFDRVQQPVGMVWLMPADPDPFGRLTEAVTARWPAYQPYAGAHETLIPHLTLIESSDAAALTRAAALAREIGPFAMRVEELELIGEAESGDWHELGRFRMRS